MVREGFWCATGQRTGGLPPACGGYPAPGHRYLLLSPDGATGSGGKYRVARRRACDPRCAAPQHLCSRAPSWPGERAGGG